MEDAGISDYGRRALEVQGMQKIIPFQFTVIASEREGSELFAENGVVVRNGESTFTAEAGTVVYFLGVCAILEEPCQFTLKHPATSIDYDHFEMEVEYVEGDSSFVLRIAREHSFLDETQVTFYRELMQKLPFGYDVLDDQVEGRERFESETNSILVEDGATRVRVKKGTVIMVDNIYVELTDDFEFELQQPADADGYKLLESVFDVEGGVLVSISRKWEKTSDLE